MSDSDAVIPPGTPIRLTNPVEEDLAAKRAELDKLLKANRERFAAIAKMGAQPDIGGLLNIRIQILAEVLFGEDGPGMVEFQVRYERVLAEITREMLGEARKAQMAAGAQLSPQQLKQMAKQQGLLGPNGNPLGG